MSDNDFKYYTETLSPIIRTILKQMSENKAVLSNDTLKEYLLKNEDFKSLYESTSVPIFNTMPESRVIPYIDMMKGYIKEEKLARIFNLLQDQKPAEEVAETFFVLLTTQIIKTDKRLGKLTEFVESIFKKMFSTQEKMTDSLEDNIRFVENDLEADHKLMDNAEEIEQILKEEGIVFPGRPFNKFMEAFDNKIDFKKDKLESMTEDYSAIEQELTEYKKEVAQLQENIQRYRQESITDHLTDLFNRKYMDIKLSEEQLRFGRHKQPFCVLLIDIDDFKNINDTYGHIIGDQVLKHLAASVKTHVRKTDFAFRYGGEEFLVLLLNTDIENSVRIAEQIRQKVESTNFALKSGTFLITITIGAAQYKEGESIDVMLERADKNLYRGKSFGKNQVVG